MSDVLITIIIVNAVLGLLPAFMAKHKGRNFYLWWCYGIAINPLVSFIHVLFIKPKDTASADTPSQLEQPTVPPVSGVMTNEEYQKVRDRLLSRPSESGGTAYTSKSRGVGSDKNGTEELREKIGKAEMTPAATDQIAEHLTTDVTPAATDQIAEHLTTDVTPAATDQIAEHLTTDVTPAATDQIAEHLTTDDGNHASDQGREEQLQRRFARPHSRTDSPLSCADQADDSQRGVALPPSAVLCAWADGEQQMFEAIRKTWGVDVRPYELGEADAQEMERRFPMAGYALTDQAQYAVERSTNSIFWHEYGAWIDLGYAKFLYGGRLYYVNVSPSVKLTQSMYDRVGKLEDMAKIMVCLSGKMGARDRTLLVLEGELGDPANDLSGKPDQTNTVADAPESGVPGPQATEPEVSKHATEVSGLPSNRLKSLRIPRVRITKRMLVVCIAVVLVLCVVGLAISSSMQGGKDKTATAVVTGSTGSVSESLSPSVGADASTDSGQVSMWTCVWYGNYPSSEITSADAVYKNLEKASWDEDGNTTVDGVQYRRVSRRDVTDHMLWPADAAAWRYFVWRPIKWRVLEKDGSTALVVADMALDCRQYNLWSSDVTWETSSVRSWLNGYGANANEMGADFTSIGFVDTAFSTDEREALLVSGDHNVTDKVFLLSEEDVAGASGAEHGFSASYYSSDVARRCKPTEFAAAMGAYAYEGGDELDGNCFWLLRSLGNGVGTVSNVPYDGCINQYDVIDDTTNGIRPALRLDLSSPYVTDAGTVYSNGEVDEVEAGY